VEADYLMEMKGEQRIAAPRARVWEALNDPDVLRQCIPGCQSLEKLSDDRLQAVVEIKIGPIGARFNGAVTISDARPPESYTISGEGQGGTVGNAKGGAKVQLAEVDGGTRLSYDVEAQVGGRLAQLGGPIIDATAKQLAGRFFTQFGKVVEAPAAAVVPVLPVESAALAAGVPIESAAQAGAPAAITPSIPIPPQQPVIVHVHAEGSALWGWIIAVALAVVGGYLLGRSEAAEWWLIVGILAIVVAAAAGYTTGKRSGDQL
jgi:carbon monoxide dehydrogenase subunit G